ncbi:hypothetical protein yrohd0001_21460 [Yersinia rohdei ATCC 43380]|nr:hypothetical protein yrohd0001_21460 [Yersinia rohdei ATCC 43380]
MAQFSSEVMNAPSQCSLSLLLLIPFNLKATIATKNSAAAKF